MKVLKKRSITLLEIMIVIFLIGLIGGVVGYNMKGSLDKGRAFKTEQAKKQIRDILLLETASGKSISDIVKEPRTYLTDSHLVKNVSDLLKDGWGEEFKIALTRDKTDVLVISDNLLKYYDKIKKEFSESEKEELEEAKNLK
jgi:general secretion pathway protein G